VNNQAAIANAGLAQQAAIARVNAIAQQYGLQMQATNANNNNLTNSYANSVNSLKGQADLLGVDYNYGKQSVAQANDTAQQDFQNSNTWASGQIQGMQQDYANNLYSTLTPYQLDVAQAGLERSNLGSLVNSGYNATVNLAKGNTAATNSLATNALLGGVADANMANSIYTTVGQGLNALVPAALKSV
jgi:hypothetical protein